MAINENTKNKSVNKDSQTMPDNDNKKAVSKDTVNQVKEKAANVLDEQKSKVTAGLTNVADSIRQVGENLRSSEDDNKIAEVTARYGETLAEKVESFSGYVENANIKDLTRDIEKFAREQPALFIGGAFLVGLLATRFLKTSAPNQQSNYDVDGNDYNTRNKLGSAKTA